MNLRALPNLKQLRTVRRLLSGRESGLTLIECLVAIAVIALSSAAITPAIVMSVATRVQSQRAEQAFQVAQSEVDRVKLIVNRSNDYTLNIALAPTAGKGIANFGSVAAPEQAPTSGAANDDKYASDLSFTKPVDVNGDGTDDFAVQIFRTESNDKGTTPVAFDLGVRVYRHDVVVNKTAAQLGVDQASLRLTSGEGNAGSQPLAVLYTSVVKSDTDRSLCDYHTFINSVTGTSVATPSGC